MRYQTKYERGLCAWPKCQEPREVDAPHSFTDETWIRLLYCKPHGRKAVARREAKIAKALASVGGSSLCRR